MKAVLYARYSPRPTGLGPECESAEAQLEACRKYCQIHDLDIIAERRDEGKSGSTTDGRPGLRDAIQITCECKGLLVARSLSRWARSTKDAIDIWEKLDKAGAHLASIKENLDTTTPTGRFTYRVLAAIAELEREQTAERTRDAMMRYQRQGRRMSKIPPYGWLVDPNNPDRLVEEPSQQVTVQDILDLDKEGLSYIQIARWLNAEGRPYLNGKRWYRQAIPRILKREKFDD